MDGVQLFLSNHMRNLLTDRSSVKPLVAFVAELDMAVRERKERVVVADADVLSGENSRAALAHDDRAASGALSGGEFYAEVFWL